MTPKYDELEELENILVRLHYPCSRLYCSCRKRISEAKLAIEKWAKEKYANKKD